jgi:tryptophan synthase alpha chain
MGRIGERFAFLKSRGEKALIAYLAAGDPAPEATPVLVRALAEAGADMIELGIPFSDPLADGPTIQAASQRALAAGITTEKALAIVRELRDGGLELPLLIMTYYNLVLHDGEEAFCRKAREAGVDGLIIPDLPLEESEGLQAAARRYGLDLVQFAAPTSAPERIRRLAQAATGFLYVVSLTGVTGERQSIPPRFREVVAEARLHAEIPVAVGFGISTPEQVREVAAIADGVIVGSAIVRLCGQPLPVDALAAQVGELVRSLKAATKNVANTG